MNLAEPFIRRLGGLEMVPKPPNGSAVPGEAGSVLE
jgi:hypothetical protein